MARNMKDANGVVFKKLADYCERRDNPVLNPTAPRWVHANPIADEILKEVHIRSEMSFGRHRNLAWLQHIDRHFIGLMGFEHDPDLPGYPVLEDVQGFDVCLIAETHVQPRASTAAVRDIVEFGAKGDLGYVGHDNAAVMELFPAIKVLESTEPLDDSIAEAAFLRFCVDESRLGSSWIEDELAMSLATLAEMVVPSLPYRELCRAVFDLDPRSLYMALYRCVEATYAYEKASKLARALSLPMSWDQLAAALDTEMGWHPPEAQSLNVALEHAHAMDLEDICDCLGVEIGKDLSVSAGRAIYRLRNQIVHYRPTNDVVDFETIDWNRLCNSMVTIALHVFHDAYR